MPKIYYGCDHVPSGWGRYFALCSALELDLTSLPTMPRKQTLSRWRVESPKGFGFVLVAEPGVAQGLLQASERGRLDLSESLRTSWQTTVANAKALAAKAIIVKTPLDFSPNPNNHKLMELFATTLHGQTKARVIWESEGMWPVRETRDFAERLGMAYAIDPFLAQRDDIPPTSKDACFVLTERAGLRRQFDADDIDLLMQWAHGYDRVFALLRGRFQWGHAQAFQQYHQESP